MTPATRAGLLILGAVGVVLVGLAVAGTMIDAVNGQLDRKNGCTTGNSPSAEIVVLVDATDTITTPTQAEVREWFRQFVNGVPDGARMTLWTLGGGGGGALQRRFCRCRPGRHVNALIGNPSMAAALSDSIFDLPFATALAGVPDVHDADITPLMESLREVCRQPEFDCPGVTRQVVVVSDLEQNSARLSFYGTKPDFVALRTAGVLAPLQVDLHGVQVDVLFIPRGRAAFNLDEGLEDFWREYFRSCGASVVRIRSV